MKQWLIRTTLQLLTMLLKALITRYSSELSKWGIKNSFVPNGIWQLYTNNPAKMSMYRAEDTEKSSFQNENM